MKERHTFFDPNIGLVTQNYIENKPRFLSTTGSYTEEAYVAMEKLIRTKCARSSSHSRRPVCACRWAPTPSPARTGQNARIVARQGRWPDADGRDHRRDVARGRVDAHGERLRLARARTRSRHHRGYGNPLTDIAAVRNVIFVMKGRKVIQK
jgi:hypothetical protein